jgi:hypothetical protein
VDRWFFSRLFYGAYGKSFKDLVYHVLPGFVTRTVSFRPLDHSDLSFRSTANPIERPEKKDFAAMRSPPRDVAFVSCTMTAMQGARKFENSVYIGLTSFVSVTHISFGGDLQYLCSPMSIR